MILKYELNSFNGVIISSDNLDTNDIKFKNDLLETLIELKKQNLQLVWLFLPLDRSILVPIAVESGFEYHNADNNGLNLTYKIVKDAYVPSFATHYIGAGGVVIDKKNRILVIQERFHKVKHYKLPGGALNPGEHISAAVVREVFEETGIKTEFESLTSFRHWHGYRFGKSDIYFVCRLKALSFDIKIDPVEITKAVWMPVEQYLSDPNTHIFNKRIVENTLNSEGLKEYVIPGYKTKETHELLF